MPETLRPAELASLVLSGAQVPVAIVALDGEDMLMSALPPCPVVGVGNPHHPLAERVDVLADSMAQAQSIAAQCLGQPNAASVLVQLLRMIEAMPMEQALVAESLAYGLLQGGAEHHEWLARQMAHRAVGPRPEGELRLQRCEDRLVMEIDRPGARNAIDRALRDALRNAFDIAAYDPDISRIVLRARGRAFSTGADLAEFGTTRDPAQAHHIRMHSLPALAVARCASRLHVQIDGACIGAGLELAAFGRTITATHKAWFQLPELAMGLIPGAGGCVSLTRRIGRQRTAQMVLSGKRITAHTALAWGLVDELL